MYKEKYEDEVKRILEEDKTYKELKNDPTNKIQMKINKFINTLHTTKEISKNEAKKIKENQLYFT